MEKCSSTPSFETMLAARGGKAGKPPAGPQPKGGSTIQRAKSQPKNPKDSAD